MRNLIVTVAITFLVNFILQIIIDFSLVKDNGNIIVSEPVKIDSTKYIQTILISNYQSKTINGLEFYSNRGTIDSIYKEDQIKIVKTENNKFQVSKLYPQINTTITVILKNKIDTNYPMITPLNNREFNFLFGKSSDFEEDVIDWITILINCLAVSIMYYLFSHFVNRNNEKRTIEAKKKLDETEKKYKANEEVLESRSKELDSQMEITRNEIRNVRDEIQQKAKETRRIEISWAKIRFLLIKQVRDLKKENEFYRSLVSDIIGKSNNKIDIGQLEELIKDNLQTYSTKIDVEKDAKLIDTIADILSEKKSE